MITTDILIKRINRLFRIISSSLFSGQRKKIATSFALGFMAGIIIFSLIFYVSYYNNSSEAQDIFGTIGLPETEVVESVTVSSANISGEIEISKGLNVYGFNINLKSSERYNLQIEFDPTNVSINNFSLANLNNIQLEKGSGFIKIAGSDTDTYSLLFSTKKLSSEKFTFKIFSNEKQIV